MSHTPTPWKVSGSCHVKETIDGQFYHVAHIGTHDDFAENPCIAEVLPRAYQQNAKQAHRPDKEQEANAHFIVQAVNSFEAMREALLKLHESASLVLSDISDKNTGWFYQLQAANQKAVKALTLANGKE